MKKVRVIVIDDSAYNRRTITKILEGVEGVEVVGYAGDGEEGIRKLYRCTIDALTAAGCPEEQIYLSLERRMQCGMGSCGHCAVGDLLCCCDGPVFRYGEVKGIAGAL